MKVKRKGWWLDRLWVELVVAAFGALVLDLHSRLVDLERRKDINAVPSISRSDDLTPGEVAYGEAWEKRSRADKRKDVNDA